MRRGVCFDIFVSQIALLLVQSFLVQICILALCVLRQVGVSKARLCKASSPQGPVKVADLQVCRPRKISKYKRYLTHRQHVAMSL